MQKLETQAYCPVEIGDHVRIEGAIHPITDIAVVQYLKNGSVEFLFELDGNGKFVQLRGLPEGTRFRTVRKNDENRTIRR